MKQRPSGGGGRPDLRQGGTRLKRLARTFVAMLSALALAGCAVQALRPVADAHHADRQSQRVTEAHQSLDALDSIDVEIVLDSDTLRARLRNRLAAALDAATGWEEVSDVSVTFLPGYVAVDIEGRYEFRPGEVLAVSLAGDLVPYYHPGRLRWRFSAHDVVVPELPGTEADSAPPGDDLAAPTDTGAAERAALTRSLETAVRQSLAENGLDGFPLELLPLGILETGVRVRAPFSLVRSESSRLAGLETIRGASHLIGPDLTRIALSLDFVPSMPDCTPTVGIGRATFARTVSNREPVDAAPGTASQDAVGVFFTDVLETREPTTVIHYWFADGRPASVTQLDVQPSARWRTWSAAPTGLGEVRRWQVLVLEKSSGCIVAQRAIELVDDSDTLASRSMGEATAVAAFDRLETVYRERTVKFDPIDESTGPALVSIDRAFFSDTLSKAMYDLHLVTTAEVGRASGRAIDARVSGVSTESLSCERRACASERLCTLEYDNCPVRRDTRDCTSCLLRNPLNNRCIQEAEDPICLAARDAENARQEELREACIARETTRRDVCLAERDRELAACQRRASLEVNACTAQLDEMASRYRSGQAVGTIGGSTTLTGALSFEFSEFRLDEDLGRFRMRVDVTPELAAQGVLEFEPTPDLGALGACFRRFNTEHEAQLTLPTWESGLVSEVVVDDAVLVANWSGLIQRLEASPSPVVRLFADHETAFSECALGLDPGRLLESLSGPGTNLLRGVVDLDLQPEPTRVTLLPGYITLDGSTWSGPAEFDGSVVRYRLDSKVDRGQAATGRWRPFP